MRSKPAISAGVARAPSTSISTSAPFGILVAEGQVDRLRRGVPGRGGAVRQEGVVAVGPEHGVERRACRPSEPQRSTTRQPRASERSSSSGSVASSGVAVRW